MSDAKWILHLAFCGEGKTLLEVHVVPTMEPAHGLGVEDDIEDRQGKSPGGRPTRAMVHVAEHAEPLAEGWAGTAAHQDVVGAGTPLNRVNGSSSAALMVMSARQAAGQIQLLRSNINRDHVQAHGLGIWNRHVPEQTA